MIRKEEISYKFLAPQIKVFFTELFVVLSRPCFALLSSPVFVCYPAGLFASGPVLLVFVGGDALTK
jgi:hypothetical protein